MVVFELGLNWVVVFQKGYPDFMVKLLEPRRYNYIVNNVIKLCRNQNWNICIN